jgi:hypothetical protein
MTRDELKAKFGPGNSKLITAQPYNCYLPRELEKSVEKFADQYESYHSNDKKLLD